MRGMRIGVCPQKKQFGINDNAKRTVWEKSKNGCGRKMVARAGKGNDRVVVTVRAKEREKRTHRRRFGTLSAKKKTELLGVRGRNALMIDGKVWKNKVARSGCARSPSSKEGEVKISIVIIWSLIGGGMTHVLSKRLESEKDRILA